MTGEFNSQNDQGRPLCEKCGAVTDGKIFDQSVRLDPSGDTFTPAEKFAFCDQACQRAYFGCQPA